MDIGEGKPDFILFPPSGSCWSLTTTNSNPVQQHRSSRNLSNRNSSNRNYCELVFRIIVGLTNLTLIQ